MKIMSIDAESNGLYGIPFAIGAVILETDDLSVQVRWSGYVDIRLLGDVDSWVENNVFPYINNLLLYSTLGDLWDTFWDWFQANKEGCLIFADFGYPVEANLFMGLVRRSDDKDAIWKGPYPLHDLGTLLLAVGADPDKTNRREWYASMPEFGGEPAILYQHNPLDDALAAGWCVIKALRTLDHMRDLTFRYESAAK